MKIHRINKKKTKRILNKNSRNNEKKENKNRIMVQGATKPLRSLYNLNY